MFKTYEMELAGKKLVIETGKMAKQANGSVVVRYGDTTVMTNVAASKEAQDGIDFFPLSVNYEEKLYAVGRIPGSFTRREGKPSDKSVLVSRAIDRPIRPLFPHDFRNDVCVTCTVLSVDQDYSPEVCAQIGTSAALAISDIPWNGPTAGVQVGYVNNEIIINPNEEQNANSRLHLTVAGTEEKITMIEAGADEISNETMLQAIKNAHVEIKKVCEFIKSIQEEIGKEKFEYKSFSVDSEFYKAVCEKYEKSMSEAVQNTDKEIRNNNVDKVAEDIKNLAIEMYGEDAESERAFDIATAIHDLEKACVRRMILEDHKRPDGRAIDEVRPLYGEVGLIPRVHGSGLFSRGQTQVLTICTLGTKKDEQELDGLDKETSKRYMHQYNFPAYSVGEARPSRGPGRREIGHGALAERALVTVLPSEEEFPYTIRLVSEVLESNGSTSQASICGSTLALMDAGVPIKKPVAGMTAGLVTDENDPNNYIVLTDIQDIEDFFGDMDFKVGGTRDGITAIQVDIKIDGLTYDFIEQAFERTEAGRNQIFDEVYTPVLPEPRKELSPYAPKIITMAISVDKIKDVIGTGGKMINKIIEQTGAKIDIEDDGRVFIYCETTEKANETKKIIEDITREIEVGKIYEGVVTRVASFGAFVNLGGDKEGLLHISKISNKRVNNVEDVLSVGDEIKVKVTNIDQQGKIDLNMRDLEKIDE
ncbi:MAG: polyribonucleotide nucleotidyltransferase [Clostridia bacterium]|nr:polyribonucleotide nucleotidyltransferase [Clostridia bacterium]